MNSLKAEFHCHIKLFSRGRFRPAQLRRRLNWARRLGLDVLAVTEHLDVPDYWEIIGCLERLCSNGSAGLHWRGVTVLPGAEVSVDEGGDILLIGTLDSLRELERRLGRPRFGNFPFFKDLLDVSEDLSFLRIGAHPCRRNKELWKMGHLLKRLDALEVNAGELPMAPWVQRQATEAGLAVVAGSDAHHWLQIGRLVNLLPCSGSFTTTELKLTVAENKVSWRREGLFPSFLRGVFKGG